jgi:hypothetical protein
MLSWVIHVLAKLVLYTYQGAMIYGMLGSTVFISLGCSVVLVCNCTIMAVFTAPGLRYLHTSEPGHGGNLGPVMFNTGTLLYDPR